MTTASPIRTGPLAGIRVLDLTAVVLGPVATQILGDCGADVVKVEPLEGDMMRANGVSRHQDMSSVFLSINRNKRSIALDLKSAQGRDALLRLARGADVLVHNMRVKAVERLGLGYAAVSAVNPGIVYCVATGFGQDGPDADKPAFDDVIQAACGLASLIGGERGQPTYAPTLLADKIAGLATANAVMAALVHKARSGEGQYVEVPMLETLAAFTMAEHMGGLTFDPPGGEVGYARLLAGGRRPMPTLDGHVAVLPYSATHWRALFAAFEREDLAAKYQLDDRNERNDRVRELYADLAGLTATLSTAACLHLFKRLDIPSTRLYAIEELPEHPHLKAVGLFQHVDHPTEGRIVSIRPQARFERTPAVLSLPAPQVGEHGDEVLREAGLSQDEIDGLAAAGVLRRPRG
ncbi:MAG: CoA transferase [Ottowia sp.]|uniref:CaiB/BaiF CoA transferase family protein n=1 Tax=Ottowia sp. TaxID=1898956 RepID=UPI0039E6E1EC